MHSSSADADMSIETGKRAFPRAGEPAAGADGVAPPVTRVAGVPMELRRLVKTYGGEQTAQAVNDVSITIPAGTFYTLLGPSGAGKSTTLMIIAGLVEPTTG